MECGCIFQVECNRQRVNITRQDSYLCFQHADTENQEIKCESPAEESVPLHDIIGITRDGDAFCNEMVVGDANASGLTLHILKRSGRILSLEQKCLTSADDACKRLETELKEYNSGTSRPKRLLVIINGNSGKKMAGSIYHKEVAPIFKLCGVSDDVRVTFSQEEARELLLTYPFDSIDGVVSVGGDGSYHECINSILLRTQRDAAVNINDPNVPINAACLPIGVIPGGSGDGTADVLHDTHDVTTAALRIVLGETVKANVVSLHIGGHLQCYTHLLLQIGVLGEVMKYAEDKRLMGPERYKEVFWKTIENAQAIEVEIEFYNDLGEKAVDSVTTGGEGNTKVTANVFSIDSFITTLVDAGEKIKPKCGDVALTVLVAKDCPISGYSQYILKFLKWEARYWDFNFISTHIAQGFKVKVLGRSQKDPEKEIYLHCDGDPFKLTKSEFDVRLHREVVRFYGNTTSM